MKSPSGGGYDFIIQKTLHEFLVSLSAPIACGTHFSHPLFLNYFLLLQIFLAKIYNFYDDVTFISNINNVANK